MAAAAVVVAVLAAVLAVVVLAATPRVPLTAPAAPAPFALALTARLGRFAGC